MKKKTDVSPIKAEIEHLVKILKPGRSYHPSQEVPTVEQYQETVLARVKMVRLAAAAPDLLKALIGTLAFVEDRASSEHDWELHKQARKAITKAGG